MSEGSSFRPKCIKILDLDEDVPDLAISKDGCDCALILVRLHRRPLGSVEIEIPIKGLKARQLKEVIGEHFQGRIEAHLRAECGGPAAEPADVSTNQLPLPCSHNLQVLLREAPGVSVVIATRDRAESLRACMPSILALDYPEFEVIIVDNAPATDETLELYRSSYAQYPQVRYIREDLPGLAIAHNRALAEVDSPIVAFTDDDVVVDRDWLKFITASFQTDPLVSCVTGMILPYEIRTQAQQWIEQFGGFGKGCEWTAFDLNENRPTSSLFPYAAGRFGSGANMAFRTRVLKQMGGFDPALGAGTVAKGGDDLSAFFETISRGHRLVYEPAALLLHRHRSDYPGLARQAYGYGIGLTSFLASAIMHRPARML